MQSCNPPSGSYIPYSNQTKLSDGMKLTEVPSLIQTKLMDGNKMDMELIEVPPNSIPYSNEAR